MAASLRLVSSNATLDVSRPWPTSRAEIAPEPIAAWVRPTVTRFNDLCSLTPGWDGYSGRPVLFQTANFAFQMLNSICTTATPAPQIVPGSGGDLQVEWHLDDQSIELRVIAPNVVRAWREFDGVEQALDLSDDFTEVVTWLSDPAEQHAPFAAAN